MRLIGHLESETLARRLSFVLGSQRIPHQMEAEEGAGWALWIHAEEDLERARRILESFLLRPDDPAFAPPAGARVAPMAGTVEAGGGGEARPERRAPVRTWAGDAGHLTWAIVIACAAVAFVTHLGDADALVKKLMISERWWRWRVTWRLFLPEVRSGEAWRLLSPVLLHFGWPHLLFNLWSFWSLGRAIEYVRGTPKLMQLMIGLALVSNLAQYAAGGPRFGGLSGVIYGLLGYVWMLGRHRPEIGLGLPPQMVVLMLAWLLVCWFDMLGVPVANTAHVVGLLVGMWWGKWEASRRG